MQQTSRPHTKHVNCLGRFDCRSRQAEVSLVSKVWQLYWNLMWQLPSKGAKDASGCGQCFEKGTQLSFHRVPLERGRWVYKCCFETFRNSLANRHWYIREQFTGNEHTTFKVFCSNSIPWKFAMRLQVLWHWWSKSLNVFTIIFIGHTKRTCFLFNQAKFLLVTW